MSSVTNKYGLSRNIPEDVKLAVRQACGFGCVVCGMSIIEYEHIDPPFHDATVHDPTKIALLCATCHGNVSKKVLVQRQDRRSPKGSTLQAHRILMGRV